MFYIGIDLKVVKKSLKEFAGIQRRLTKVCEINGNDFFDDYAITQQKSSLFWIV